MSVINRTAIPIDGGSDHSFTIPSDWDGTNGNDAISNGDLILAIAGCSETGGTYSTIDADYTSLFSYSNANTVIESFRKTADGTEAGSTVTLTHTTTEAAVVHLFHLSVWASVEFEAPVIDTNTESLDIQSITPTWGAKAGTVFIPMAYVRNVDTTISAPANYTTNNLSTQHGDTTGGSGTPNPGTMATSYREANVTTEDPGSFTWTGVDHAFSAIIAIEPAAGTTTTLTFDQGSYAVTGQDFALRQVEVLSFEQGTYTITGSTAELLETDIMAFGQGAYSITGQDIGFKQTDILSFGQGSYSITGQDIGLVSVDVLDFQQGSYAITGNDIGLITTTTTTMSFEQGSYSITGQDIGLKQVDVLSFGQGSYAVTGQDIGLRQVDVLSFDQGTYNITGQPIGFVEIKVLDFEQGTYSITGQDFRIVISSPEVLTLDSEIATFIELDSEITTDLNLDSEI